MEPHSLLHPGLSPAAGARRGALTLESKAEQVVADISGEGPGILPLNALVQDPDEVLGHGLQEGHKVFDSLWGHDLLVQGHSVFLPGLGLPEKAQPPTM